MENKKTRICFIGANPNFDGGMGLYQRNLNDYIKENNKNLDITCLYSGKEEKEYIKDGIRCVQIKNNLPYPLNQIVDNFKILKYIRENEFDVINSHALWGYWMRNYKKRKNQIIVHTYHGVTYNFFKNHMRRFSFLKRIFISPILIFSYIIEKPPIKKADRIICVSEKVKRQLEKLYITKRKMDVLRTGVNIKDFNPKNREYVRKRLHLESNKIYGLYVGRGGYWTKGLDRTVKISEEIYKKNKDYRTIVIGAEYNKVKNIIQNKKSLIYLEKVPRKNMRLYYSASDIFFCLSRYEGGAPTLVTSEAMASGCLLVCSKDSKQEIIESGKNGLIIENFDKNDAERIINLLNNKKNKDEIIKNSIKTIRELSLEKWGEKYSKILKI